MRFEVGSVIFGGPTIATVLALTSVINPFTAAIVAGATFLFGLTYVLSKTVWIDPGEVGIVVDYLSDNKAKEIGELEAKVDAEKLAPGVHTLLSPFRSLIKKMPFQKDITVRLEPFEVKSKDNIDALVQADFTYKITHAGSALVRVDSLEQSVKERVKGALSAILQRKSYQEMNTSALEEKDIKQEPAPAKQVSSIEPKPSVTPVAEVKQNSVVSMEDPSGPQKPNVTPVAVEVKQNPMQDPSVPQKPNVTPVAAGGKINSAPPLPGFDNIAGFRVVFPPNVSTEKRPFTAVNESIPPLSESFAERCLRELKEFLKSWGVDVYPNSVRIISVEPKERKIRDLMEETGILQQQAKAKLTAAKQDAERMQILATAEADANNKRAEGALRASKTLDSKCNPDALKIYELGLQFDATNNLANGNLVAIGGNVGASVLPSLVRNPATLHSGVNAANLKRVSSASALPKMKDTNNLLPLSAPA